MSNLCHFCPDGTGQLTDEVWKCLLTLAESDKRIVRACTGHEALLLEEGYKVTRLSPFVNPKEAAGLTETAISGLIDGLLDASTLDQGAKADMLMYLAMQRLELEVDGYSEAQAEWFADQELAIAEGGPE